MGYSIGIINHLVMTNIAMENPQNRWRFLAGKNGKSSISMGHGFHGYVKLPECKPSISDPWIFTYIHQMKICRKAGSLFFISDQSSRSIGLRQCPIVLWTTLSPLSWDRCMPVIRKMAGTPSYPSLQIWQVGLGHIITGVRQAVDWMGMKSQVERCVALKRERVPQYIPLASIIFSLSSLSDNRLLHATKTIHRFEKSRSLWFFKW